MSRRARLVVSKNYMYKQKMYVLVILLIPLFFHLRWNNLGCIAILAEGGGNKRIIIRCSIMTPPRVLYQKIFFF